MLRVLIVSCCTFIAVHSSSRGFDDTVLFDINWPGKQNDLSLETDSEYMIVTSSHQEQYKCILPTLSEKESSAEEEYKGPSGLELIKPLFQSSCTYRLESYWTYEICHGNYIKQYHEDREGKKVKLQDYILGRFETANFDKLLQSSKAQEDDKNTQLPVKKIDNFNLPYLEVTMDNGTLCDLNQNKPRITKVLYVCYIHGKHEVYSLKETSTCIYEIIILSPILCSHPRYRPKKSNENKINCIPLGEATNKPHDLIVLNAKGAELRKNQDIELIRLTDSQIAEMQSKDKKIAESKPLDTSPVKSFLSGKNCLNGGVGWWKYEFCYGKSVEQYHIEKSGNKISIKLGYFDKSKHLAWINEHPHKRPKPLAQRTQLSHFYSDGTVCDKTGNPRQTEVKLKCLEHSTGVSLYLLEPRPCEYILGVESPLICDILSQADENGLVESIESTEESLEVPVVNIVPT